MRKIFWFGHKSSYSGLIGILSSQGRTWLFSRRSGQFWVTYDLPSLPGTVYGERTANTCVPGIWRFDKKLGIYVCDNETSKRIINTKDLGERDDIFCIVRDRSDYYLRWGGVSHKLKWRRSSETEFGLMASF